MIFHVFATLVASVMAAPRQQTYGCDVSSAQMSLPSTLSPPSGAGPQFIALGAGTQNYTCSASGTYTSAGAVATLFDLSCLEQSDIETFNNIQTYAYNVIGNWNNVVSVLAPYTHVLGKHYFVSQSGTIAPKFDFTQTGNGYVISKKIGGASSPDGSQNVDWLELQNTSGTLAKYVYRINTQGGQPPASCTAGQTVTVPYTAKYWFYN
ncbi:hypothetical protein RhiXN_11812 [Rhizoctonia solani]|uniref:Malate dehydrogenase n=1 Tax=Rhizoctonia solani TaxID=456999 RepID=A0A8H8P5J3_9AGAM|nr:uncharacterized protein RhiXN_11812 [Rhizoctonia solani]QRW24900.1 hypothetical protein RhiXN_11812 [Rhizoctonia solani]